MIYTMEYASPVGKLTIAGSEKSITGLWIEGQKYFGSTLRGEQICSGQPPVLKQAAEWLDRYFAGERPLQTELPLAPVGGEFRQAVWKLLCEIPYGEVTSYKKLAEKIAAGRGLKTMSAQAVGGAVGHNPISIIIPCHRVLGTDGSLTGYAGGIDRKRMLLVLEGVTITVK